MTTTELGVRVTVGSMALVALVALGAGWLAGASGALGALAAGALALGNFLWLARGASRVTGRTAGPVARGWALTFGARYLAVTVVLGVLLATGRAHPLAVVAGLTVLPCVLVAIGLGAGRSGPSSA